MISNRALKIARQAVSGKIDIAQVRCFAVDNDSQVLLMLHGIDDDKAEQNSIQSSYNRKKMTRYFVVSDQLLNADFLSDVKHSGNGKRRGENDEEPTCYIGIHEKTPL